MRRAMLDMLRIARPDIRSISISEPRIQGNTDLPCARVHQLPPTAPPAILDMLRIEWVGLVDGSSCEWNF